MKKLLETYSQALALIATIVGIVYFLNILVIEFPKLGIFINSPFFTSLATFVVGLIAYIVYLKQKSDEKRDIAKLIVQEIRYAEIEIRRIKQRGNADYFLSKKLIPTNSWHKNIHLFISDLEAIKVDMISDFYSRVEFLDYLIKIIVDKRATASGPQMITVQAPVGESINNQFIFQDPAYDLLKIVTDNEVEYIYNSSAIDVLKKIAKIQ